MNRNLTGQSRLLPGLLVASLALHALALLALPETPPARAAQHVIGLNIVMPGSATPAQPQTAQAPARDRTPPPASRPPAQTIAPRTTAPAPIEPRQVADTTAASTPAGQPSDDTGHSDQRLETIRQAVHNELAANFRYPLLARKRGMEGNVVLQLNILADGTLDHVSVADSSGHRLLDMAAVASARNITLKTGLHGWPGSRHIELRVPVHYRLTGT